VQMQVDQQQQPYPLLQGPHSCCRPQSKKQGKIQTISYGEYKKKQPLIAAAFMNKI
jgi:hypothetical protein